MPRNTRELLISTAWAVMLRDGLGASVNAILAEARLSKGVFFHHFDSKRALLLEIIDRDFKARVERIKAAARDLPETPFRMLRAYVLDWIEDAVRVGERQLNALVFYEEAPIRERMIEQRKHLLDMLWHPRISEATVKMVLCACDGAWILSGAGGNGREDTTAARKNLAAELFRVMECGCGVPA